MISYGVPKGHGPVWLPKSYGPEPLVGITLRCGHMQTGVLWVICVLFGHGVERYVRVPYRLRKVHVGAPYGPIWIPYGHGNIYTVPCGCRAGLGISVRSVVQGLTGSGQDQD